MLTLVKTYDLVTGEPVSERELDFRHRDSRAWLERQVSYAINHGQIVQVCASADEKLAA